MPALHKVPTSLLLKIGSVWWRYKNEVQTTGVDPLKCYMGKFRNCKYNIMDVWNQQYVYDDISNSINTTYNMGIENGTNICIYTCSSSCSESYAGGSLSS